MLGCHDNKSAGQEVLATEPLHHSSYGLVGMKEGVFEDRARLSTTIEIPAVFGLLSHTDRLKIHSEQGRNANLAQSGVVLAVDFVQNSCNFQVVIRLDIFDIPKRPNFRGEKIIHTLARRSIHKVISGVFIRPRCPATALSNHFEDCVYTNEVVREGRRASPFWVSR